ncbi:MAG: sugar phosphate isomerase/epimerase [Opitutaceae bacterium]|nr:sugar phosphate isomerase/epimerase [Opitutaceae bacterium]
MKPSPLTLTGISDEAGKSIEKQIQAHKELGWTSIELRLINGLNATWSLPEDQFQQAAEKIEEAGLTVTGFGSAIGNWSRSITDDFAIDLNELEIAIPRMQRFKTKFIRTMSWLGDGVDDATWKKESIRRYKELAKIAEKAGIYLAHENCAGWGGLSPQNMNTFIEEVGSSHVVTLYDIGNVISHGDDPWDFYQQLDKQYIAYVHIKDARKNPEGGSSSHFTYPGEGDAMVKEILQDLPKVGYEGVVSIEPHIASIIHKTDENAASEDLMYNSYLEYGRKAAALL